MTIIPPLDPEPVTIPGQDPPDVDPPAEAPVIDPPESPVISPPEIEPTQTA